MPGRASAPAQEQAPGPDSGTWTGKIKGVATKSGKDPDTGKPWTLFTITGEDGESFMSYSQTVCDFALESRGSDVELKWTKTKKGNRRVESLNPAMSTQREPGDEDPGA